MANQKISDLAAGTPLQATDEFVVRRGTTNVNLTGTDVQGAEATGTEGQDVGFDSTPEAVAYTARPVASINTDGSDGTVKFVPNFAGTIVACTGETDTGTINIAVAIDGVSVTGLAAVALDSTIAGNRDTASAANTFSAGDVISVTRSGAASSPTEVLTVIEMTRTSLPAALA